MDTGDVLLLGGIGVAAFFGWRWYKGLPVANAGQTDGGSLAARNASSLSADAARQTLFGGSTLFRNLLTPTSVVRSSKVGIDPTGAPVKVQNPLLPAVVGAQFAAQVNAPSPSASRVQSPDMQLQLSPTMPRGDQPQPSAYIGNVLVRGLGVMA